MNTTADDRYNIIQHPDGSVSATRRSWSAVAPSPFSQGVYDLWLLGHRGRNFYVNGADAIREIQKGDN